EARATRRLQLFSSPRVDREDRGEPRSCEQRKGRARSRRWLVPRGIRRARHSLPTSEDANRRAARGAADHQEALERRAGELRRRALQDPQRLCGAETCLEAASEDHSRWLWPGAAQGRRRGSRRLESNPADRREVRRAAARRGHEVRRRRIPTSRGHPPRAPPPPPATAPETPPPPIPPPD